jgi:hypothetical protein
MSKLVTLPGYRTSEDVVKLIVRNPLFDGVAVAHPSVVDREQPTQQITYLLVLDELVIEIRVDGGYVERPVKSSIEHCAAVIKQYPDHQLVRKALLGRAALKKTQA